jgi:hypothetical protein
MSRVRHALGDVMCVVCGWIDGLPDWTWHIPLLHRLGCPRGLALWSFRVDPEHWGLNDGEPPAARD